MKKKIVVNPTTMRFECELSNDIPEYDQRLAFMIRMFNRLEEDILNKDFDHALRQCIHGKLFLLKYMVK